MYKNISELKNKHLNQDIWLLLAGSSMDYVDNSFFENKITIGQNQIFEHFKCDYVIMKDCMERPRFPRSIELCKKQNIPLIFSEYFKGRVTDIKNQPEYYENSYMFSHNSRKESLENELEQLSDDQIVVSKSTMTSLLHIAAYMGAKNIIICGHDCGTINGNLYYKNYGQSDWKSSMNWSGIDSFISSLEQESVTVKNYLIKKYNCNIHSLNPFINLNLESNIFVKS